MSINSENVKEGKEITIEIGSGSSKIAKVLKENDAIKKLEPLTNFYFIQAKQIATSIPNNKEIINAINNWCQLHLFEGGCLCKNI